MIENMIKAKNFGSGLFYLRQIFLSIFDMVCHSTNDKIDTYELFSKLKHEISLIENTKGTNGAASFLHITSDFEYDAGYYGYIYSEVFSLDVFSFFKKDLFSNEVGMLFRKKVLEIGGDEDCDVILKNFLNRIPDNSSFLESIGL
jgi:thimet oligopeptidase